MEEPYTHTINVEKESIQALVECIDLQLQKSKDYQNPNSTVKQADYYPSGVKTIYETIWGKLLRVRSLLEAAAGGQDGPNFESIEDSFKDLINYSSFAVAYIRGEIEGQDPFRDMFNREYDRDESIVGERRSGR